MEFIKMKYFSVASLYVNLVMVMCRTFDDTRNVHEAILNYYANGDTPLTGIIPLEDHSKPLSVMLTMQLYSFDGLDVLHGQANLTGSLYLEWNDETMVSAVGNYTSSYKQQGASVQLAPESIWTPPIRLVNAVTSDSKVGDASHVVRYHAYDGRMMWHTKVIMKTKCLPDVRYFPFDRHECSFILSAWGYTDEEIRLNFAQSDWDLCTFNFSGEWTLLETKTELFVSNNQSNLKFILKFERKSSYLVLNMIFPFVLLSFLNSFSFLLPVESNERIACSLTCLVSFVILLDVVVGFLPRTADPLPLLSVYILIMMFINVFICILTVLTLPLFCKKDTETVPICLQGCVKLIICSTCTSKYQKCIQISKNSGNDKNESGLMVINEQAISSATATTGSSISKQAASSATATSGSSISKQAASSATATTGSSISKQAASSATATSGSSISKQAASSATATSGSSISKQAASSATATSGSSISKQAASSATATSGSSISKQAASSATATSGSSISKQAASSATATSGSSSSSQRTIHCSSSTPLTSENTGGKYMESCKEQQTSDHVTWPVVCNTLDKILFLIFLGGQIVMSSLFTIYLATASK